MTAPNPASVSLQYGDTPQEQNDPCSSYFTRIKGAASIQLVGGCLLVVMGIVAIILKAYWSYFAIPIWSGIVIFSLTGGIGISAASKGSKCLARAYLAMSILGCFMGFALFVLYFSAALFEKQGRWWRGYYYSDICQPGSYSEFIPNCSKSLAARKTLDALISCTGFVLFILSIVAASYGCCASCKGCESCCKQGCCSYGGCSHCCTPTPQPVTAVFQPQGPTFAPTGQQQAGKYVVKQGPAPVTQYPKVAMPPPASSNQPYIVMPAGSQMPAVNQAPPPTQAPSYYEQPDSNQKA